MSERFRAVRVDGKGPTYPAWVSEAFAELALVRTFEFTVDRRPGGPGGPDYDFFVTAPGGGNCFVKVNGFSSHHLKLKDAASVPEWLWSVAADEVRTGHRGGAPLVMFVYDVVSEHGRFARLDTLPEPEPNARRVLVRFLVENTITPESLRELIAGLKPQPAAVG